MKILVFGSLNIDHDYYVDHLMVPGETMAADSLVLAPGGKGLNQAIALAKAGIEVSLAGCIGPDGGLLEQTMASYHVDGRLLKHCTEPNGHAIITIDHHGANSIMIYGGANQQVDHDYVDMILAQYQAGDIIIVENEISEMPYLLQQAHAKGLIIAANPSPFDDKISQWPLKSIDWFFINETEGALLTGVTETNLIVEALPHMYPQSRFVLTLGSQGAVYVDANQNIKVPACHVKAVDTVGAGDTFMGYFVAGLYHQWPIEKCLKTASTAAALCVSRKGAASAVPTMAEVENAVFPE